MNKISVYKTIQMVDQTEKAVEKPYEPPVFEQHTAEDMDNKYNLLAEEMIDNNIKRNLAEVEKELLLYRR